MLNWTFYYHMYAGRVIDSLGIRTNQLVQKFRDKEEKFVSNWDLMGVSYTMPVRDFKTLKAFPRLRNTLLKNSDSILHVQTLLGKTLLFISSWKIT